MHGRWLKCLHIPVHSMRVDKNIGFVLHKLKSHLNLPLLLGHSIQLR